MNLLPGWFSLTIITLLGGLLHTYAYPTDNEESNYEIDTHLTVPDLSSLFEYENEIPAEWPSPKTLPEKRGPCHGTACVYSHIGAKAGHSSLRRLKLTLLRECIDDPLCFAAGRKKRSIRKATKPDFLKAYMRLKRSSLHQQSP